MELLVNILPWIQVTLGIILIGIVLVQQSSAGVGGAFGGSDGGGVSHTRRGAEKFLFQTTIVLGIIFTLSVFTSLLI